jgi:hypothetical protein
MKTFAIALSFALPLIAMTCLAACSKTEVAETGPRPSPTTDIAPVDLPFMIAGFKQCSAKPAPGTTLSEAEKCWIRTLTARCNSGDDCIVSCLSAGVSGKIGGGCAHLCSQPPGKLANWRPPANLEACDAFGKVNGF